MCVCVCVSITHTYRRNKMIIISTTSQHNRRSRVEATLVLASDLVVCFRSPQQVRSPVRALHDARREFLSYRNLNGILVWFHERWQLLFAAKDKKVFVDISGQCWNFWKKYSVRFLKINSNLFLLKNYIFTTQNSSKTIKIQDIISPCDQLIGHAVDIFIEKNLLFVFRLSKCDICVLAMFFSCLMFLRASIYGSVFQVDLRK